ncbi:MAG TPA: MATE family efflux transporter [Steroidobacteraceae bacterium]|nr:MATE family efflux transporter [Steroidobacteraceae bacterium]
MIERFAPQAPSETRYHLGSILKLGLPLIVNNLAISGMGLADTVITGHYATHDQAAVSVGFNFYVIFYLAGLGVLMAVSPITAHAYGAGRHRSVGDFMRHALWLSFGLSAVLIVIMLASFTPVMRLIGVDPGIVPLARKYVHALAFGLPAVLAYLALRYTSEGLGRTRPAMYCSVLGFAATVLFDYLLVFGKLGLPEMGAMGCAVTTLSVKWLMLGTLYWYMKSRRFYQPFELFGGFAWPNRERLREIVALGLPIAGSVCAEGTLFSVAGLLMGSFGAQTVAAHQSALSYASLMFMVPLAMHSAMTVHVGHSNGRGDHAAARRAGFVGIALCTAIMTVSAIVIAIGHGAIARLYSNDPIVQSMTAGLLLLAGVFQIGDGLQVGAAGALRGFRDTRIPMVCNLIAYWAIGFPLAYGLGVTAHLGPRGVWWGLIAGILTCALLLNLRYRSISLRVVKEPAAV